MPPNLRTLLLLSALTLPVAAQSSAEPPRKLQLQPLSPDAAADPNGSEKSTPVDLRQAYPRYAFVESPWGFTQPTTFAALTAAAVNAKSQTESQAGVRLGAAFDRVTVHALLGRGFDERWSPTVTAHVRALGSPTQGYALGLLGQDKTEGLLPRPQRARWRRARRRRGRRARRGGQARTGAFGLLTIGAASSL